MRKWLWPPLTLGNFDRELEIACRGIGTLLGVALCAYLVLTGMPQTLMSALYDAFAIVAVIALMFAISRRSLICTVGLIALIGYDVIVNLTMDSALITVIFDLGLLYFLFRALRVVMAKRVPAASAN